MGSPDRPPKQEAFLALLAEGWTSLHLDARRAGVVVPAHLKGEPHLVLQYGHDLPIPIPDLQVDEHGVSATLSFARTPSPTVVPWSAVYVVTAMDGRGVLYQEDIPSDVSVIAASGSDAGREGDGADVPAAAGDRPATSAAGAGTEAQVGTRAPTPARALRAVPLTGPLEDDHPALAASYGGMVTAGPPAEAIAPSRRRKRPQLRLVK
jgi:stringent starvation protein B